MKKGFILLLVLFTALLSFSVSAEILTIGGASSGFVDWLKTLFTGGLSIEDLFLPSLLLYFMLFMAIYYEGLFRLPIFGRRREVSKAGSAFAFAAASLTTFAIFMIDDHVSMKDRLEHLLAPFGIWGAFALAAIIAFIAYRAVRDSEVFDEGILGPMAITAAIACMFVGFLLGLGNLLGWGFLIALLVLLIGLIGSLTGGSSSSSPAPLRPGYDDGTTPRPPGGGGGGGPGGPRPPGPVVPPTVTPPNPTDPPTPPVPTPGEVDDPTPPTPDIPDGPVIPDDKEIHYDLSPFFTGIRSQGTLGSCTAMAGSAMLEYVLHRGFGHPKDWMSPLYLYYKNRQVDGSIDHDVGSYTRTTMNNLVNVGVCWEKMWSYEDNTTSNRWREVPPPNADEDAILKRVLEYHWVNQTDPDQWVHMLGSGHPLNIAVNVPKDWHSGFSESYYHNEDPTLGGGHAMVIVGYHSHYPVEGRGVKAFKIRNSWGASWGENGYIWVSAKTLQKILRRAPAVIGGWNPSNLKKIRATIHGRVIYDVSTYGRIPAQRSGEELYRDSTLPCPKDHKFKIQVLAQIQGNLRVLFEDREVSDHSARFTCSFEYDPNLIEHLTQLPKRFPLAVAGIDFSKLPKGVIVYKSPTDEDIVALHKEKGKKEAEEIIRKQEFLHIVNFEISKGGRGGHGSTNPNNPCSSFVIEGIANSGVPISFSEEHTKEEFVIIPVHNYTKSEPFKSKESKEVKNHLKKIKKAAAKERDWVASEYSYLKQFEGDIEQEKQKYDEHIINVAKGHFRMLSRSESKVNRFQHRVEKNVLKLLNDLVADAPNYTKYIQGILFELGKFNQVLYVEDSRYAGEIGKLLNDLEGENRKVRRGALLDELKKHIEKAIEFANALQVELRKLENLEEYVQNHSATESAS